jgi:archaemetzincin
MTRRAAAPIAIQPIGDVSLAQVQLLERILERVYDAPAVVLRALALPREAWSGERRQYDADPLLDALFLELPERCLRVVGVTEADLFIPGRTFVFGYAHLTDGMALYSLRRLREGFYGRAASEARTAARVLRAVVHELGHTFGVPHCEHGGCVMRAVSAVDTLDALSPRYCVPCLQRVRRGLKVAPWSARGRWERGLALYRRNLPARAVEQLEHATRSAPLDAAYLYDLGVARLAAGDREGARAAFVRARELSPDREAYTDPRDDLQAALGR